LPNAANTVFETCVINTNHILCSGRLWYTQTGSSNRALLEIPAVNYKLSELFPCPEIPDSFLK
jgi:hypothetical protein